MLLDTSNSIRDRLKFEQDASTNFLFSVLRHHKDEAFVLTFDDEPQVIQKFTGDAGALRDEIFKTRAGGGTAIYDAIYSACLNELSHPPRPPGDQPDVVRRVMILISDGDDNLSTRTRAEAIEMAQRASVVIYTISTSTQWIALSQTDPAKAANRKNHLTPGDQILLDLAEETGGRAFFPYHVDDLINRFRTSGRAAQPILYSLQPYQLHYGRPLPQNPHRNPDHKGYQVRARRGYLQSQRRLPATPQPAPR
jgi:VWFA-related protein